MFNHCFAYPVTEFKLVVVVDVGCVVCVIIVVQLGDLRHHQGARVIDFYGVQTRGGGGGVPLKKRWLGS